MKGLRGALISGSCNQNRGGQNVNVAVMLDCDTLAERAAYVFGPAENIAPEYALDTQRRWLYIGHMTSVQLEIYAMP